MPYSEIIDICSQMHTKHINTLCGQNVPRSKHSVSVIKANQLMLYSKIIDVCSQMHTKHINTLCGQNVPRSKHTPSRLQKPIS
jgi:proteasome assembly chaperone (PAC2) family protein